MQLIIDHVPYEVEQTDPKKLVLHSEHYASKLTVRTRFTEKHAGFTYWHSEDNPQFIYVTADEDEGTVTFESLSGTVTLEMIETWWSAYFDSINELGYETLGRAH